VFAVMVLSMGLLPELLRPLFGNHFALAWHPAMTIVMLIFVLWSACKPRDENPGHAGTDSLTSAGTQS